MEWSTEDADRVRAMWEDGMTASQIARVLGNRSRNAVISKIHRTGGSARATPNTPVRAMAKRIRARRIQPPRFKPEPEPLAAAAPVHAAPLDPSLGVLGLSAELCHYPFGDPKGADFAFCGRPANGCYSYCVEHQKLCYRRESAEQKRARRALARFLAAGGRTPAAAV